MKSQEDVERLLGDLGKRWPEDYSIVDRVMQRIDSRLPVQNYIDKKKF